MTTDDRRSITVYMEATPNPAALKFVTNISLLTSGSAEFSSKDESVASPLAHGLFAFTGVRAVFIAENFVTVTKTEDIEWYEMQNIIREYIRSFLIAGDDIFDVHLMHQLQRKKEEAPPLPNIAPAPINSAVTFTAAEVAEISQKIIATLDEYVKPAVAQDGGAIDFKSFDAGVVTLVMKGSCSGCPSSTITLKQGIERVLKSMIPEVHEVVAQQ